VTEPGTDPVTERPHPLSPLVKGWIAVAAVVAYIVQDIPRGGLGDWERMWWLLAAAVGVGFLGPLVIGYFSWRFTRFVIDDEQVRIEHRFIEHRSERIAFTKIQSVDVVQPLVARIIGLAALRIDIGSQGGSKTIEYLSRQRAYQLRDYLVARAHGTQLSAEGSFAQPVGGLFEDRSAADRVVVRVPALRLVGATLLGEGFVVPALVTIGVSALGVALSGDLRAVVGAVLAAPVALALASILVSRLRTELNFTLTVTAAGGVRVARGLTSLVSQTIPLDRIQGIEICQSLPWRPFGWYRMRMSVLGYAIGGDEGQVSTVLLPVGHRDDVDAVLAAVWPSVDVGSIPLRRVPRRARWFRWLDAQTFAWGHDEQVLVAVGHLLVSRMAIVPHARVQSVRLVQGPVQRRLRLASVEAHISPGPVILTCQHLDAADARHLAMTELDRMRSARGRAHKIIGVDRGSSTTDDQPQ